MSGITRRIADGLQNLISGLGTLRSKSAHNQFVLDGPMSQAELDAAYQSNWLARAIVDYPAEDMTREWRTIKCKDAEEIARAEDELKLLCATQEALCWARLHGGAAILMITGQPLEEPLNINRIKKGDLKRLVVFDRWELGAQSYNMTNVLAANYLLPEYYMLNSATTARIHWTHFAFFQGARLPRRIRQQTLGWGDSELRKCLRDLKGTVAAKEGIEELMQEANVDIIRKAGLYDIMASDQDQEAISRYTKYGQMKSNYHLGLLDDDEEFERHTLALSGVAPVLETLMTWVSGAADIPVTRLFGTSAKGMNATGEGDMDNYHNSIRSKQNSQLADPIRTLDEVMVRSAIGSWPGDFSYQWNPLEQQNAVEVAQAEYLRAQKHALLQDASIIRASQIQKVLRANEEYQFEDGTIEELEKLEAQDPFGDLLNNDPEADSDQEPEPSPNADK